MLANEAVQLPVPRRAVIALLGGRGVARDPGSQLGGGALGPFHIPGLLALQGEQPAHVLEVPLKQRDALLRLRERAL